MTICTPSLNPIPFSILFCTKLSFFKGDHSAPAWSFEMSALCSMYLSYGGVELAYVLPEEF